MPLRCVLHLFVEPLETYQIANNLDGVALVDHEGFFAFVGADLDRLATPVRPVL